VAPGVQVRFVEAGHMLGSASIQVLVDEDGCTAPWCFRATWVRRVRRFYAMRNRSPRRTWFSSSRRNGDRDHRPFDETVHEFIEILQQAVARRSKCWRPPSPSGARNCSPRCSPGVSQPQRRTISVFLDSPMAIEASQIYARHQELFDDEMIASSRRGRWRKTWLR